MNEMAETKCVQYLSSSEPRDSDGEQTLQILREMLAQTHAEIDRLGANLLATTWDKPKIAIERMIDTVHQERHITLSIIELLKDKP